MAHITLVCSSCGDTQAADMAVLSCLRCGSPVEVEYVVGGPPSPGHGQGDAASTVPSPLHDPTMAVSLGEGRTPCVRLSETGRVLGIDRLYAKLEFMSPTGSFKDRGSAVLMSVAREYGVPELVEDSSGNAGASIAAYAARAGIRAHIFAPSSAPATKVRQIGVYGAEAHLIAGPRQAAADAAVAFCEDRGLIYASHALSPFFLEGTKTFAYELVQQFAGELPADILFPVGNGTLYIGAFRGFEELRRTGLIARLPRMHCVQTAAVRPVVAAFTDEAWRPAEAGPTAAVGIAIARPPRLDRMVSILRTTGGTAVIVEEEAILRWQKLLAESEGVFVEPTSAVVLVGLDRLVQTGAIGNAGSVVVPLTGSGLKDDVPA